MGYRGILRLLREINKREMNQYILSPKYSRNSTNIMEYDADRYRDTIQERQVYSDEVGIMTE